MAEKRLIDAMQTVIKMSGRITPLIQMGANPNQVYNEVLQVVAEAPTVDAVEVVRCKDCKWVYRDPYSGCYYCHERQVQSTHFCSYGERKEGDGNG